jgi:hypothetical protein
MAEYAGYVPVPSVDWAKAMTDVATGIRKVQQEREAERQELDKQADDTITTINEYSSSKAPTFNDFIMTGANTTRDYIMEQNRLLKSGQIKPSEYTRRVSNTKDGWTRLSEVAKDFDKRYEETVARMESGEASAMEVYMNQYAADLMNLKGKSIVPDPNNGRVFVTKYGDKGNVDGIYDVQTLNAGLNQRQSKVNAIAEVDNAVKGLGETAFVDPKTGKYTLSPMIRSSYQTKIKPNIVKSILTDNRKVASILADNVGGFTFTMDKKEAAADSNKILLVADENGIMQPQINSEKQRKIAEEYIGNMIDSRVDFKQAAPEAPQQRQQREMTEAEYKRYMSSQEAADRSRNLDRMVKTGHTGMPGDYGNIIVGKQLKTPGLQDYIIYSFYPKGNNIEVVFRREPTPEERGKEGAGNVAKTPTVKRVYSKEVFKGLANEIINSQEGEYKINYKDLNLGGRIDFSNK